MLKSYLESLPVKSSPDLITISSILVKLRNFYPQNINSITFTAEDFLLFLALITKYIVHYFLTFPDKTMRHSYLLKPKNETI